MERLRRYYTVEESNSESSLRIWRTAALIVTIIEAFLLIYQAVLLVLDEIKHESWINPTFVFSGCAVALFFLICGIACFKFDDFFLLVHLIAYQAALTVVNCSLLVSIVICLLYDRTYFIRAVEEYIKEREIKDSVVELLVFESLYLIIWFIYRSLASFAIYKYYKARTIHRYLMSTYEPIDMHSTVY